MKPFPPWGRRRLSFLLEAAASREARTWAVYVPKKPSSQDTDVSPAQRDEAVRWLTELHVKLQLYPETLVLAVSVLDRFLAPIKARPKYLRCIAVTSFFLAAKICEEDECVPPLKELAASSRCGCSPSEILRMERIILDKLNWDLHTATALDFLHIFHATAASCRSQFLDSTSGLDPSQHLALLTRRLYTCLADHTLLQLRGSTLALALLTLELEACCPDWLVLTIDLLRRTQIDSSELIRSRELVARSLSAQSAAPPPNTVYIYQPRPPSCCQPRPPTCCPPGTTTSQDHPLCTPVQPPTAAAEGGRSFSSALLSPKQLKQLQRVTLRCKASTKRKVEQMEVDDFYDGIKRLYNEDPAVQEGTSSPCPPLQPVGSS